MRGKKQSTHFRNTHTHTHTHTHTNWYTYTHTNTNTNTNRHRSRSLPHTHTHTHPTPDGSHGSPQPVHFLFFSSHLPAPHTHTHTYTHSHHHPSHFLVKENSHDKCHRQTPVLADCFFFTKTTLQTCSAATVITHQLGRQLSGGHCLNSVCVRASMVTSVSFFGHVQTRLTDMKV